MKKVKQVLLTVASLVLIISLFQNCGSDHNYNFESSAALELDSSIQQVEIDFSESNVDLTLREGSPLQIEATEDSSYSFPVDLEKKSGASTLRIVGSSIVSDSLSISDSGEYAVLKNNATIISLKLTVTPFSETPDSNL